jgi:hypothetical protein
MIGLKAALLLGVVLTTMSSGFYWYYQDTQKRMAILVGNNVKLEQAVSTNEKTIKDLGILNQAANNEITRVNSELQQSRSQNRELVDRLAKHDLGLLGNQKPDLVQRIINNASDKVGRCFEILSGAPLSDVERNAKDGKQFNSECPWLYSPSINP